MTETAEERWTVFYATETGNSRKIAETMSARAQAAGIATELQDLATARPRMLAKLKRALFVVATHGIGEPPAGTEAFFELWLGDNAPRLEQLEYSVIALGDSSYADFCETGRQLDERLFELGATRIADRADCDLDFQATAQEWTEEVLDKSGHSPVGEVPTRSTLRAVQVSPAITPLAPFRSRVLTNQRITATHPARTCGTLSST